MKRFYLSGLVFAALCFSSTYKVKADFGSADITSKKNEITKFDAWCGKRGDDCTVEFAADKIIIDGTSSVKYDKIKSFTYDQIASTCASGQVFFCRKKQYDFEISYERKDGSEGRGAVLFGSEKVAINFMRMIGNVAVREYIVDPRCGTPGKAFYQGSCIDKTRANLLKAKDIKESRQEFADNLNEALEKQRQYDLKERELDIMEYDAITPDVIQNNQLNIQQNQQNLQQNNWFR